MVGCDVLYDEDTQNDADLDARFPGKLLCLHCDVSKADQLRRVFEVTREKHGRVDVVVPNAAVVQEQNADFMTAVNFMGVVTAVRLGLEYMSKASGGSGGDVVVMNSISSFLPVSYYPVYCGAKAGVLHYIRSLVSSKSHSGTGVRVISVPESSTRSSSISSPEFVGLL